jgi:hypothetical protein
MTPPNAGSAAQPHDGAQTPTGADCGRGSTADVLTSREQLIFHILTYDKEIFELKRCHELSMERVRQSQNRELKKMGDGAMFAEQDMSAITALVVGSNDYFIRQTYHHTVQWRRLRHTKVAIVVSFYVLAWVFLYVHFIVNPEFVYVASAKRLAHNRDELSKAIAAEEQRSSGVKPLGVESWIELRQRENI